MYKKVTCLLLLAFVADVYSGAIVAPSAALISSKSELAEDAETDSHPSYSFSYSVDDVSTGDHKSQFESRDGDSVVGRYTLLEPTGETRQVDYTADAVNGFNAVVSRHPTAKIVAAAPAKIIAQPAIVAPAKLVSQPIIAAPAKIYAPAPAKIIAATPVATKLVSAPIVAHPVATKLVSAPIVAAPAYTKFAYSAPYTAYSAPLVAQYHAPAAAAYISHSPLTYHAPAATIIHH